MDMKISKKDIKLLLYTGGVLLLVVVYFVFYRNISQKSEEMEARIEVLETEKNELEDLNNRKEEYKEETAEMQKEIEAVLAEFPADIREENAIVYGNMLENVSGMEISGISIGSKNLLYSTGQGAANNANEQNTGNNQNVDNTQTTETTNVPAAGPTHYLYGMPINYSFTVDYSSFKKAAELISENKEKRNMESMTLSFDSETGKLVGTATVNMYFMLGGESVYQKPDLPPMQQGVDDIFGTVGSSSNEGERASDTE